MTLHEIVGTTAPSHDRLVTEHSARVAKASGTLGLIGRC